MQHAVFTGPGAIEIETGPIPKPHADQVLVEVRACGLCGSDRAIFAGTHPATVPVVLGHEYAGIVVERGSEVTQLEVGDRITVDPNIVCGRCTYCRRGQINLCRNLTPLGVVLPGGYSEYSLVPESNAYRIAESTSFDQAALVEPLACCVHGIGQARVQLADAVVVLGAGPIGLMLAQLARLRGAGTLICVDPLPDRRRLAKDVGADVVADADPRALRELVNVSTSGEGADVVIESAGRTAVAELTLDLVRPGGTVVWFGACPEDERLSVTPFAVGDHEITVRGSNINPFTHQTALTLIERGRVQVDQLISERIGLAELAQALEGPVSSPGKLLVVPKPGH